MRPRERSAVISHIAGRRTGLLQFRFFASLCLLGRQLLVHLRFMTRWSGTGRSALLWGVTACVLACGGAEKKDTLFAPLEAPGEVLDVPPESMMLPVVDVPPPDAVGPSTSEMVPTGVLEGLGSTPLGSQEGTGCKPANGVSGSPKTISDAIILINTLPKPTSLECFLQALDRPLTLYMTSSDQSLQPAPGPRSPRTFVLRDDLEMSIVFEGLASNTLEFGYRPEISRSIKTEIIFPVTRDLSEDTIFDRIVKTPRTTECGACHVGEAHEEYPGFPAGVYVSDVNPPYDIFEVKIDSLKEEASSCDKVAEPYRCGLLSAIFDYGDTVQGVLRGKE
jgi:hypothetical protein